jgi:hypothetical protein
LGAQNNSCEFATYVYNEVMIKVSNFRLTQTAATDLNADREKPSVTVLPLRTSSEESLEPVLSVTQFALEAGVTPQAVRKMIAEGRLKASKIGNQHSIPVGELVRYLQTIG